MAKSFQTFFMGAAGGGSSPYWIALYGGSGSESAGTIAVDSSDNIMVGGTHLIKYSLDGSLTWQKNFTSLAGGEGGISLDSSDNIYAVGQIYPGALATIVKSNSSGAQQWGKQFGNASYDINYKSATDSSGNTYAVGLIRNGGGAGQTNKPTVQKYNSSGVAQWRKSFNWSQTSHVGNGQGISIDSAGYIVFSGTHYGTNEPSVISKTNSSGSLQYSKKVTIGTQGQFLSVATDGSTNSYVAGWADGAAPAGSVRQGTVAKFTSGGSSVWGRKVSVNFSGTYKAVKFWNCALDSSDNLYVVGESRDTNDVLSGNILKYNSSGVLQWQRRIGTGSSTSLKAVAITSDDSIVVAGYISGAGSGSNDIFTAYLAADGSGTGTYASNITYESSSLADASLSLSLSNTGYSFDNTSGTETNYPNASSDASLTSTLYSVG